MEWILFVFLIGSSVGETKVLCRSSRNEVVLNFTVPEFRQKEKTKHKTQFIELSVPGAGITSEIGSPQLPVIRKFIEIPENAEITVETEVLKRETVRLSSPVYPRQPPVPKIPNPIIEFAMDTDYYTRDEFLPQVRAQIADISEMRGHRVAMIEVYPILYNPSQNVIDFASDIQVTIRFHKANWGATRSKLERYYSIPYEAELKDIIVNYDYYKSCIKSPSLPIGYLIITPDSWYNTVLPLADWKEQKGYRVTVTKLSEVGSGDENQVRDYIKNAYDTWTVPPTYVLLVGDVDKIGYFEGHVDDDVTTATDLYFSTMGGSGDYTPDLYLFRFSVANASQLANLVNKTIKYERNDWSNGTDWCSKAYFVASEDADYYDVAEGTHKYCMQKCRANGMTCDSLWLWDDTGTGVSLALGDGRSWVMYSGHGWSDGWGETSCNPSWVAVDRIPFVGTFACLCGSYANSACFSEKMIREGNRGAITNFASSNYSYWDPDDAMQRAMFNAAFNSNITWAMGMFNSGRAATKLHFGSKASKNYYEQYNMMGDGSVDIYWDTPHPITVAHPSLIVLGPVDLEVTVNDGGNPVKEALVCARRSDTIFVGYTNSSGQVTLGMVNNTECTLTITVTGHNLHTYEGSCVVIAGVEITLISPNGGEIWSGGSIHDISWSCDNPDSVDHYRLLYSTNGGSTYPDTIAHNIPNTATSYSWTLPAINSSTARVKVQPLTASNRLLNEDQSDSNFTIQTYLTLTSPNGGEEWAGGSAHQITWTTVGTGFDSYRLLFLIAPDSSWDTVASSISSPHDYPNDYDHTWTISHPGAQRIIVHFSKFNTEATYDFVYLYDKNDNQIAKYDGNKGAFWAQEVPGDEVKIRIKTDDSETRYGFDVDKYTAFQTGASYCDTIATISPSNTSYLWTLPLINSSRCKVKVQILDGLLNVVAEDLSDDYFAIKIHTTLISPNGGEEWAGGSIYPITWSTFGESFDSYKLLYTAEPASWHDVTYSVSSSHPYSNSYDHTWTISHPGAQKMKVHFSQFNTEATYDFVYLYDKNNNEIAKYDGNKGAFWTQEVPGDKVKIRLKTDDSETRHGFDVNEYSCFTETIDYSNTIATNIPPNSTSYNWTLPATPCTTVKVKVQMLNSLKGIIAEDESNDYFSIIEPESSITVTEPNGEEFWSRGSSHNITWTSIDVSGDVKIELYKGGSFNITIATNAANNGSYDWLIPASQTSGTDYKVRITSVDNSSIWDDSDNDFKIGEVGAEITPILPRSYKLSQAYPSPGIRKITIPYQLPEPAKISLNVYDITGKLVHTLINTKQAPGYHSIVWNVRDIPNGIYFYKLDTPTFTQTKKLIILQ